MAILKNCEIHYVFLDPKRPRKNMDPKKPAAWGFQMRTKSKEQRAEWLSHHINVKAVRQDPKDEESPILYYRANMNKRVVNAKGEDAKPVEIRSGFGDIEPRSIGSGSIVNVRIFEYEYTIDGQTKMAAMPMAIQMVKHVQYEGGPVEDFDEDIMEERVEAPKKEYKVADKSATSAALDDDDDDSDNGKY